MLLTTFIYHVKSSSRFAPAYLETYTYMTVLPRDLINLIFKYCGIFRPGNVLLAQDISKYKVAEYPRKTCVLENKVEWKNKEEIGKYCENLTNYKVVKLRDIYDQHFNTPLPSEYSNTLYFQRAGEFATFEEERLFDVYDMHHILLIDMKEMCVLLNVECEGLTDSGIFIGLMQYVSMDNFPILQVYLSLNKFATDQCRDILSDIGYCNKTTAEGNVLVNLKLQQLTFEY
jgi:hypothetical protein